MQYVSDFVDYLKNLAVTHPDILHQDTEGQEAFSAIYIDELLGDFRNKMKPQAITLHAVRYSFNVLDINCPETKRMIGFIVMGFANKGDFSGRMTMESTVEKILLQILLRMQADSKNGHPLFNYSQDILKDISVQPYELKVSPQYSGWIVTLPIHTNIDFTNDQTLWTDKGSNDGLTPIP